MSDDTDNLVNQVPRVPKDKYRFLFELGRGGMGSVFLAMAQGPVGFSKLHVLKLLKADLASDNEFLKMFLEEARLSARIIHPNVVQTHEVGFDGTHYFIAMEYLDGQSLHSVVRRSDKPPEFTLAMHLRVLAETLMGLHHAHELADYSGKALNVVHRDVSPQNVFITYDGSIKILDFGIAKAADSSMETRTGVIKGKVAYMAPEQFKGKVDRRVDVYAAGAMLWQSLTGQRLWKGMSDVEIYTALNTDGVPPPSSVSTREIDSELEAMCMKALSFKAEDRYATASDFQADIEAYLRRTGSHVSARDVGKCVSELFADRRSEVRVAIDTRTKQLEAERLAGVTASVENTDPHAPRLSILSQTGSTQMAVDPPPPSAQGRRPNRSLLFAAGGAAAMGLAIIAIGVTRSNNTAPPPQTAAPQPSALGAPAVVQAAASPAAPATVDLHISASPSNAKVYLDDMPLVNPSNMKFPRDGATHRFRAEAPGYDRRDELVTFNVATLNVLLPLEKSGTKKAGSTPNKSAVATGATTGAVAPPPPPAPPPESTAPAPTASTKKKTTLDTQDPWTKPAN